MASILHQDPDSKTDLGASGFDPSEISHAVCACQVHATPRLALCETDCTDAAYGLTPTVCVVCAEICRHHEPCRICGGLD